MPLRPSSLLSLLLPLLLGLPPGSARAQASAPAGREWASAQCVAALDAQTETLAQQIKAGRADLRSVLRARLKAGAAFIGRAYLDGERDEARSQALLRQAREAQRGLPVSELSARQGRCAAEGERLLADADPISRAVVSRLAERRMKKMLEG